MSNTWLFLQLYDMIVSRIVFLIPQIQDFFDLPIQLRQRGVFMRKLGGQGQKWLKCLHLICVCFWVGGAITMTLMNFVLSATDGMELYGLNTAKLFVDYYISFPEPTAACSRAYSMRFLPVGVGSDTAGS